MAKQKTAVIQRVDEDGRLDRVLLQLSPPESRDSLNAIVIVKASYDCKTENSTPTGEQLEILLDVWELLKEVADSLCPKAWEAFSYTYAGTIVWAFYTHDSKAFVQGAFTKPFPIQVSLTVEQDPIWQYWRNYYGNADIST